jgi:hypothetical protein
VLLYLKARLVNKANAKLKAELAALAEMMPAQLVQHWMETEAPVPPKLPAPLLRRLLAQRLQERRLGALPAAVARELGRTGGSEPARPGRQAVPLTPGARLVREWNGQTISVEVRADGFWWKERTWRSLSEIAREVTGAHWSGPRFFGLHRRA